MYIVHIRERLFFSLSSVCTLKKVIKDFDSKGRCTKGGPKGLEKK